jgi:hypothetical protein
VGLELELFVVEPEIHGESLRAPHRRVAQGAAFKVD